MPSRRAFLVGGLALGGTLTAVGLSLPATAVGRPLNDRLRRLNDRMPCQVRSIEPTTLLERPPAVAGWQLSARNPVLDVAPDTPWERAAVYDPCVVQLDDGSLNMWYATRGSRSCIGLAHDTTGSGDVWTRRAEPVLAPDPPEQPAYREITRPSVVRTAQGWRMWYSVVGPDAGSGEAWIGTATSVDGISWQKHGTPVLTPTEPWEGRALQCPNVMFDAESALYRMWYSGGQTYEPDAVGYATSADGISWSRAAANPIYTPSTGWEDYKLGSFQVTRLGEWHYAFYNALQRDPYVGRIGMARSRDGLTNWERHPANPVLGPDRPCTWNSALVYKPTALWDAQQQRWHVWFNASMLLNAEERIGHAWSEAMW